MQRKKQPPRRCSLKRCSFLLNVDILKDFLFVLDSSCFSWKCKMTLFGKKLLHKIKKDIANKKVTF